MADKRTPRGESLTARRKAATELDIARVAAGMFTERGRDGVTSEEIARVAGVAPRTFYRYFRTKEDAIAPLLSRGAEQWRTHLRTELQTAPFATALERAARAALDAPDELTAEGLRQARGVLRAATGDPALRAVWHRVNQDSEDAVADILAESSVAFGDPVQSRMAAAAATAAIRIAMESWAADDTQVNGPGGPAELAARCIRTLTAGIFTA